MSPPATEYAKPLRINLTFDGYVDVDAYVGIDGMPQVIRYESRLLAAMSGISVMESSFCRVILGVCLMPDLAKLLLNRMYLS